jgi:transcriptional regulator with XRE-family HTH domain
MPKESRTKEGKPELARVGERIRMLRSDERQQNFAAFLGLSQGQLSKIERGKVAPSVEVLLKLRDRYGKKVDWILTGKE